MVKTKVNCSLEVDIKLKAEGLGLGFSECLIFGLAFKEAEQDDVEYPSNILSKKIESLSEKLGKALRRIEELEAEKIGDPETWEGRMI